jgi:hypothetical protein
LNRRHFFGALAGLAAALAPQVASGTSLDFPPLGYKRLQIYRWYFSNENPVELGVVGERYIVAGYLWLPEEGRYEELRVRTGN